MGNCCECVCEGKGLKVEIALKIPKGKGYKLFSIGNNFEIASIESDINVWLREILRWKEYFNFIYYNDEPPDMEASSYYGHCKGILMWNSVEIIWLIHSVPKYPSDLRNINEVEIRPAELEFGQSFILVQGIDPKLFDSIKIQMKIMNPNIYAYNCDLSLFRGRRAYRGQSRSMTLSGGDGGETSLQVWHVAKSNSEDIYEHICNAFGGKWTCETWRRGSFCPETTSIRDCKLMEWGSSPPNAGILLIETSRDHSKYAVSDSGHVFVGDLNRMTTQYNRSGGGIVVRSDFACREIGSIIAGNHS
jgi:deoxyribonuclease II